MSRARTGFVLCGLVSFALVTTPTPGAAADPLVCKGETATIVGTDDADIITGTPERDVIIGFGGDDIIYGHGGDDLICGFDGDDTLVGGPGDDWILGGSGADVISGGSGADSLHGEDGADEIRGGGKGDSIFGGAGADLLLGPTGDDILHGGNGYDRIRGQAGIDLVDGSVGIDRCIAETEHNCEIVRVGERIDVYQGPEILDFPAGTPFHVWHGWACNPAEIDCAMAGADTVDFQLLFDGVAAEAQGIELTTIVDEWRQKIWVYNFPEGMSGSYTISGSWTESGVAAFGREIIVNFP